MKKIIVSALLLSAFLMISCSSDSEKADKLRLENKFEEAAELYQKAADEGDAYAKWRLSNAYGNGDGVPCDKEKALELLKEASKEGCEEATCDLALAYMFDTYNIGKNVPKGIEIIENLAEKTSNSYVMAEYAWNISDENERKTVDILKNIKDKNNPAYLFAMGQLYFYGNSIIDIDVDKAIEYFTKAFEQGYRASAQYLSYIYDNGYGDVKPSKDKKIAWLKRGCDSNQIDCMANMAMIYLSDDSTYHDYRNPQKGIELLKKAALRGNGDAYYNLGNLYYKGEHVPKDDVNAFNCWEKAANLNDPHGADNLAYAYMEGVGCEKDIEKGLEIYKKAVEYGSGFAANKLFYAYWTGERGVQIDKSLAKMYLLKAAELGDPVGCFNLGKHYAKGSQLINKNLDQAFVYIKKAADMGLVDACKIIALFYENGIGIDKNPQKAKEYRDKTIIEDEGK